MAEQRIQKVLADQGICSRREAERLIAAGKEANCGQEPREDRLLEEEIATELLKI